jgi:hypothetical protein
VLHAIVRQFERRRKVEDEETRQVRCQRNVPAKTGILIGTWANPVDRGRPEQVNLDVLCVVKDQQVGPTRARTPRSRSTMPSRSSVRSTRQSPCCPSKASAKVSPTENSRSGQLEVLVLATSARDIRRVPFAGGTRTAGRDRGPCHMDVLGRCRRPISGSAHRHANTPIDGLPCPGSKEVNGRWGEVSVRAVPLVRSGEDRAHLDWVGGAAEQSVTHIRTSIGTGECSGHGKSSEWQFPLP